VRATLESILAGFARRQLGVAPRGQLRDAGLRPHHVDYLLRTRRLERVFQSVYRVAGAPTSWEQMLLAACWAGGERGAVASHRAACALWDLPGAEPLLEITGPRWRRARHAAVVPHESRRLDPIDLTVLDGVIPVTRPARTFLDCCALVALGAMNEGVAEQVLEEAVRRNLADIALVGTRWEALGGELRLGGRVAQRLIDRWLPATAKTDSRAEVAVYRLLRDAGLPDPTPQHRVWLGPDDCVDLDLAWPGEKVGLPFDSYRWHGGRLKHDTDATRVLQLQARGWTIVRVTDAELDAGCPNVLAVLARILRHAA
jgi:hypothetical protein